MRVQENSGVAFSGVVSSCPNQILFILFVDATGMYMYFFLDVMSIST